MKVYPNAKKDLFKNHLIKNKFGYGISFEKVIWDKPNLVLLKCNNMGYKYITLEHNELEKIYEFDNLYEVITAGMPRKIFFDWDGKQTETYISYYNAETIATAFKEFIKSFYKIEGIIKCVIQASIEKDFIMKSKDDKCFKSLHFIFNIYTKTNTEAKQIVNEFLNTYPNEYATKEFIDLSVYSNMRYMRCEGQNKKERTDKIKIINTWNYKKMNNLNHLFITAISPTDIFLEVEPKFTKKLINTTYNILYDIQQFDALNEVISKFNEYEINKKNWWNNLHLIISSLLIGGIKWNDILQHSITQEFLKISNQGEYNTPINHTNNIKIINDMCEKQPYIKVVKHKDLFTALTEEEKHFIYTNINLPATELVIISNKNIKNKMYLQIHIGNVETEPKLNLYDIKKNVLLINCCVKDDITGKKIFTEFQYHLYFDALQKSKPKFNDIPFIPFTTWDELSTNINENAYYEAPVGSGKSSNRMYKDIEAILNDTDNIILMICDNKAIGRAHHNRVIDITSNIINYDSDFTHHYDDYRKTAHVLNESNTKIVITTYDSAFKFSHINFTHIIIDEYLNVRKRINKVAGHNTQKQLQLDNFYRFLSNAKCVKCYDADLMHTDLTFLSNNTNKTYKYYKLVDYTQYNNTIIFSSHSRVKNNILNDIMNNKNISISSNSLKKANKIYDWIKKVKPNIAIALFSSEDTKAINPNEWNKFQVVIYTPKIITGISCDIENHFYRHYGFICRFSTDFTQSSQMLFRVRKLITKTIIICDMTDTTNTFKKSIQDENQSHINEYHNTNLTNKLNNYNSQLIKNDTTLNTINNIEQNEEHDRQYFYYNLFKSFAKWGCNIFKCEMYDFLNEIKPRLVRDIDKDYDYISLSAETNYATYLSHNYIFDINNSSISETKKQKTFILKQFGYTALNYHKYSQLPLYNSVVHYIITNTNEKTRYNRISKLKYYPIRNIIYKFTEAFGIGMIDLKEMHIKEKIVNQKNECISLFVALYIVFKIFDLYTPINNYEEFMDLMTGVKIGCININFDNDTFENDINISILLQYLVNTKVITGYNSKDIITFAFGYFKNNKMDVLIFSNKIKVASVYEGIPYRYEKNVYEIETGATKPLYQSIDLDDFNNWVNCDITYTTNFKRDIDINYCPKIKAFDYYINENICSKDINILHHYFDNYCNLDNANLLCKELNELCSNHKKTKATRERLENVYNDINSIENDMKTIETKYIITELYDNETIKKILFTTDYYISNIGRVFYIFNDIIYNIPIEILNVPINKCRLQEDYKALSTMYAATTIFLPINYVILNSQYYFIERLVAEAFLTNYRSDFHIQHIDNNYNNDNIENLHMSEVWDKSIYGSIKETTKTERKTATKANRNEKSKDKIPCAKCSKLISRKNKAIHEKLCKIELVHFTKNNKKYCFKIIG